MKDIKAPSALDIARWGVLTERLMKGIEEAYPEGESSSQGESLTSHDAEEYEYPSEVRRSSSYYKTGAELNERLATHMGITLEELAALRKRLGRV